MSDRWRVIAPDLLTWRELDAQWLLHDAGSARLHLLDELTVAVLSTLETDAASAAEIARRLAADAGQPVDTALVAEAIANLVAVDLVESVAS